MRWISEQLSSVRFIVITVLYVSVPVAVRAHDLAYVSVFVLALRIPVSVTVCTDFHALTVLSLPYLNAHPRLRH
jgi:hypothetical protein